VCHYQSFSASTYTDKLVVKSKVANQPIYCMFRPWRKGGVTERSGRRDFSAHVIFCCLETPPDASVAAR
jgi:hypothetical protein